VIDHRTGFATGVMKTATWLGSTAVLIPLVVALAGYMLARRRDWRPGAVVVVVLAGVIALYNIVKPAVGRARPPMGSWIGHYSGHSFPSGHATQSIAFYGAAALMLGAGKAAKVKTWLWAIAATIVLVVGVSRLYLGAHWLSDVLGGWALGAAWLALVAGVTLVLGGTGASVSPFGGRTRPPAVGYPSPP
jgi:membrane-associated phospholipid phosphatase